MDRSPEPDLARRVRPEEGRAPDTPAAACPDETRATEAVVDEAAADEARQRFREQGIVPIEPDARIGVMLAPGERVVAVHREASLERRKGWRGPAGGMDGNLYVTTERLVHLGRASVEYPLAEICEVIVGTGAIRLVVADSQGVEIGVVYPRVLRVEIAAVREARAIATEVPGAPGTSSRGTADGDSSNGGAANEDATAGRPAR